MISVTFLESEDSKTLDSVDQWTTGYMLKVTGLTLNDHFSIGFTHSAMSCEDLAVDRLGKSYNNISVIPVPNYLFTVVGTITVTVSDKTIIIPVQAASNPSDYADNCKCDTDVDRAMIAEALSSGGGSGGVSFDDIYPIGSIYMSVNSTSPATLFGGTWEQLKDTFLLAAGDSYSAGETGGEATHTLTREEQPEVKGQLEFRLAGGANIPNIYGSSSSTPFTYEGNIGSVWKNQASATSNSSGKNTVITFDNGGKGEAHNNMPPYLSVYMWKRVG